MDNTRLVRSDIHRPSAINPSEYHYVGFEALKIESLGDALVMQAERENIRRHMAMTGGTYSHHAHGGNCQVCGNANAIYTVLFHHQPTNVYVRMGQDCAQKCDVAFSEGDFDAFKNSCKAAIERKAGKAKARALLDERGLSRAWEIYSEVTGQKHGERVSTFTKAHEIFCDLLNKLISYGDLSDKQYELLGKLVFQIDNAEAIEAQRLSEKEAASPCPSGRLVIEGTVLSLKSVESIYGYVTKMLVQHDSGYKVWGTKPSGADFDKGARVSFKATFEPSKDDAKFGFFSRPNSLKVISTGIENAV